MPIDKDEPNYLALRGLDVPEDLLDLAIERGSKTELLVQKLLNSRIINTKQLWQLLLLGKGDFNYQEQPSIFWEQEDTNGFRSIYYVFISDDFEILHWIQTHNPALFTEKDKNGLTIAHYAARSGNPEMLSWVQTHYPALFTEKDKDGLTIVYYAAQSGKPEMLRYLLRELPELTKQLWIMPQTHAPESMSPKPNQILNEALLEAMNRVIHDQQKQNDFLLLLAFQHEWSDWLTKNADSQLHNLSGHVLKFPKALQDIIHPLLAKHFLFERGEITLSQLIQIIELVDLSDPSAPSAFLHTLRNFCLHCEQDTFSPEDRPKEVHCLQVLIEDYRRGLLGPRSPMRDLIVHQLTDSKTLEPFKPKPPSTKALDITPANAMVHFEMFKKRVETLPLKRDEAGIMKTVILPGLECLIQHEDDIVEHARTRFGVLYYLDGKKKQLPLHTDHTPAVDSKAYRATLQRLVAHFFGAVDIAYRAGLLIEFCGRITPGFCFEGRVRNAFTWASSLSEVVSFDRLMAGFMDEYQAYAQVMYHQDDVEAAFIEPVADFIMARHKEKLCLPNSQYAPEGKVTQAGVESYLEEVLCYSRKFPVLVEIEILLDTLKKERLGFFAKAGLKDTKITVLTELKRLLQAGQSPAEAVRLLKADYPEAIKGFHSRIHALFKKLDPEFVSIENSKQLFPTFLK